jgi:3-oxoacyl-[acyl-carrier-protein] synthase II
MHWSSASSAGRSEQVRRRVVITGMGVVSPLGMGQRTVFDRWVAGEVGIERGRAECTDFDPGQVLSRKQLRRTNRFTQFALVAAHEAFSQAGWTEGLPTDPERIACMIGSCFGGMAAIERQAQVLAVHGAERVNALTSPMMLTDSACGSVAICHGLKGPSQCVASACAAGADAIGTAVRMIRCGDVDAAVAGGADACITPLTEVAHMKIGAVSPTGISRPFDIRRDGFVLGEGAGLLALEEASVAEQRGAEVLGEILGYGATTDACHITAPAPGGEQAARAIELALADAGVAPEEVAYINAHGTSTPLNDKVETQAIKTALRGAAKQIPISSMKSVAGHTMGAAGALEAITTVEALRRRWAPPTVGLEQQDPELDLDYVPGNPRLLLAGANGNRLTALSNSFGFGGHNAVLCVAAEEVERCWSA